MSGKASRENLGASKDPAIVRHEVPPCQLGRTNLIRHVSFSYANQQSDFSSLWYQKVEGRLFRPLRALRGTKTSVDGKFFFCFFFMPGSHQRSTERVVNVGICRHETLRGTQGRNCVCIFLVANQEKLPSPGRLRQNWD